MEHDYTLLNLDSFLRGSLFFFFFKEYSTHLKFVKLPGTFTTFSQCMWLELWTDGSKNSHEDLNWNINIVVVCRLRGISIFILCYTCVLKLQRLDCVIIVSNIILVRSSFDSLIFFFFFFFNKDNSCFNPLDVFVSISGSWFGRLDPMMVRPELEDSQLFVKDS